MPESFGRIKNVLELNAQVYPPCHCGEPWTAHGKCGGYRPTKALVDYGTVYFVSADWLANFLFKIEQLIQRLRRSRMRRM